MILQKISNQFNQIWICDKISEPFEVANKHLLIIFESRPSRPQILWPSVSICMQTCIQTIWINILNTTSSQSLSNRRKYTIRKSRLMEGSLKNPQSRFFLITPSFLGVHGIFLDTRTPPDILVKKLNNFLEIVQFSEKTNKDILAGGKLCQLEAYLWFLKPKGPFLAHFAPFFSCPSSSMPTFETDWLTDGCGFWVLQTRPNQPKPY